MSDTHEECCSAQYTKSCGQWCVRLNRVPVTERPQLILSAEEELGITAGLQDRVIQVL